jgi:hypothetical protein
VINVLPLPFIALTSFIDIVFDGSEKAKTFGAATHADVCNHTRNCSASRQFEIFVIQFIFVHSEPFHPDYNHSLLEAHCSDR